MSFFSSSGIMAATQTGATVAEIGTFDVSGSDPRPTGVFFKPDGTVMYVLGSFNGVLLQYALLTPWDIETASLSHTEDISGSLAGLLVIGFYFKPDGSNLYFSTSGNDDIYQFALSVPWELSTIGPLIINDISGQADSRVDMVFNDSGTKMLVMSPFQGLEGGMGGLALSIAWDPSSGTNDGSHLFGGGVVDQPRGMAIDPTGQILMIAGDGTISGFEMDNPFDLATLTQTPGFAPGKSQTYSLYFRSDGRRYFISQSNGIGERRIVAYSMTPGWTLPD